MRILHVIENLDTGGAEHMLINLATEQVLRHHQVAVMCLFDLGELAGQLTALGVDVTACHKKTGAGFAVIRRMMAIVRRFQPEVIHTHSLMGNYYLAFVRLWVAPRCVQVVTRHGLLREGNVQRLNRLFDLSLWMTHWAVGVCEAVSEELLTKHPRFVARIKTIKNGIPLTHFQQRTPDAQAALKTALALPKKTRLLGIVARLNPVKNHNLLLDAFALVQQQQPDSALIIIGDGAMRSELEAAAARLRISSATFFLGDRTDVNTLLAGLDVFVLSSDNEGYSLALLEAAAACLPMVATDVGGNNTIVQHGETGLIVPPKDPKALADALLTLIHNPEQADTMGRNARVWVEHNGSVQAMADAYAQLYKGNA